MNNGKQFLDIVCNRLRDKSRLLHDSNIVSEINNMRWNEIKQACAADSGAPAEQSGNNRSDEIAFLERLREYCKKDFCSTDDCDLLMEYTNDRIAQLRAVR